MRTPTRLAALLAAGLLLSACGSLRLYSETRDQQGQAARTAWNGVDLSGFFAQEKAQRAKVLALELSVSDNLVAAQRELAIRRLSAMSVAQLAAAIDQEFDALVMEPPADAAARDARAGDLVALATAQQQLQAQREGLARAQSFLQSHGAPSFSCDELAAREQDPFKRWHDGADAGAKLQADKARESCQRIAKHDTEREQTLKRFSGASAVATSLRALAGAEQQAQRQRSEALARQHDFEAARDAYQAALAAAEPGRSKQEVAADRAATLLKAVAALEKLQNALGDQILSEQRLAQIRDVLGSWKDGSQPGADDTAAQVALKSLPQLAEDAAAIEHARSGRSLAPLMMVRDVEAGRLGAARTQQQFAEQNIELLRAIAEAQLAQAQALATARSNLARVPRDAPAGPLATGWGLKPGASPEARTAVVAAADLYLDAIGRLRQRTDRLRRTRYALALEESAALSDVNAGRWTALIGDSVQQSAEFASLGLKPTDISQIVTAIGVLGIAHGTNR